MTRTVLTQDPRTVELAVQMRPLVFRLYDLVRRHSPQLTTTLTQNSVLATLVTDGPQRMSVLAEREGVRLPTMTNVVGRLERAGYLRRESDPDDRRVVMVSATPQARRDVARVRTVREAFLQERLARLSAKDQESISRALPALERLLDQ
jgi:DNA-binding MarR family transcriptional regulator